MYKLNELADFIVGKNNNRLDDSSDEYSTQDFEYDLYHPYRDDQNEIKSTNPDDICTGDIVINLQTGKAAIAGKNSHKKSFSQRFAKVIFHTEFPPLYFLYLMNENKAFQKEKAIYSTGSVTKRLSNHALEQCSIKRLPLEQEKLIGEIYASSVMIKTETLEQIDKMLELNMAILEKQIN